MGDQSVEEIEELERQKKRFLKRYRKNQACIRRLENKLKKLNDQILSCKTSNLSGMPRGGVPVTMDELIADKDDLENRIKRLKAKSRGLKNAVHEEIDNLEDPRYCEILEAYFIDGLSIEKIAEKIGYTERHVYTLYSEAIRYLSVISQ